MKKNGWRTRAVAAKMALKKGSQGRMLKTIYPTVVPRKSVWRIPDLGSVLLFAGFASVAVPTVLRMAQLGWSTEAGAHGPIVLATAIWLVWREKDCFRVSAHQPFLRGALLLVLVLPLYVVGRVTSILMLESLALYLIILALVFIRFGAATISRYGLFGVKFFNWYWCH
ncbi:MAG: hypothetical protein EOO61_04725 [Hymenobacter sp.]|nr:MAG: hypothetical protein EOO61_04725 [Hymenobacter sp.]